MSTSKSVSEGLKPQECKRSAGRVKPPIPYIPAAQSSNDTIMKVKVSDKMMLSVSVFHMGTPEQFLSHVQKTLDIISQRGLDTEYQEACKADHKAEEKLTAAIEATEKDKGMDENPPSLKALKKATAAKECTGKTIESAIQKVFMQYSTLLLEEAALPT